DASLGLDNGRRAHRWLFLRVLRSWRGIRCAATADEFLRNTTVGGARSGTGPRFPERTDRIAGLRRSRSGRLACRITACAWWHRGDLRWRQVRQPSAREADAVGILWALAADRGAAGTTWVIEAEDRSLSVQCSR